jgi:phospholipase C
MQISLRRTLALGAASALAIAGAVSAVATSAVAAPASSEHHSGSTATPIKHLVVIFQENVSFDHYFGTYPTAANSDGQPFHARQGTPHVNGLTTRLLTSNPNTSNPQRLGPAQAVTCDQDHAYTAEQQAFDNGKMDKFVQFTDVPTCPPPLFSAPGLVMDYYDGNTVTGLWNYAQRFSMSDNSYGTEFGPSTPGALNLISGQTYGAVAKDASGNTVTDPGVAAHPNASGVGTVIGDPRPFLDDCSNHAAHTAELTGPNVGDLLSRRNVSWGWFQGGFTPSSRTATGAAVCATSHAAIDGVPTGDYIMHHNPFQYYASTANPHHLPPASVAEIGHNGQANHQYDLSYFTAALNSGNLPAVSYLKAAAYQDGHAGYSDPIDEQHFLVNTINQLQQSKYWRDTAVVIAYDDSDGWYDHQASTIVNPSQDPANDALTSPGVCGSQATPLQGLQDRCGFGPRLPLLVISPFAQVNHVDHRLTSQSSILRFVEDNWLHGQRIGNGSFDAISGSLSGMFNWRDPETRPLILDPATGQQVG